MAAGGGSKPSAGGKKRSSAARAAPSPSSPSGLPSFLAFLDVQDFRGQQRAEVAYEALLACAGVAGFAHGYATQSFATTFAYWLAAAAVAFAVTVPGWPWLFQRHPVAWLAELPAADRDEEEEEEEGEADGEEEEEEAEDDAGGAGGSGGDDGANGGGSNSKAGGAAAAAKASAASRASTTAVARRVAKT